MLHFVKVQNFNYFQKSNQDNNNNFWERKQTSKQEMKTIRKEEKLNYWKNFYGRCRFEQFLR